MNKILIFSIFLLAIILVTIPFISNYVGVTNSKNISSTIFGSTACKDKIDALVGLCNEKGQVYCSNINKCVDINIDNQNCGSCGIICTSGKKCSLGICTMEPFTLVYSNIQKDMDIVLPVILRFKNKPIKIDWGDGITTIDTVINHKYLQNYRTVTIRIYGVNLIQGILPPEPVAPQPVAPQPTGRPVRPPVRPVVPVVPVMPVAPVIQSTPYPNLIKIESFGLNILYSISYKGMVDLIYVPPILPSTIIDASYMFDGCKNFNQDISTWNTSNVIDMSSMFSDCTSFNQKLNNWNTNNVNDMTRMFSGATSFNQPIGNWNTSNVTNMSYMFSDCSSFNQNLSSWNTSNVNDMTRMFSGAISFNQPITNWNTSKVTDMSYMFNGAIFFNQSLNNWKLNNLFTCQGMFCNIPRFNKDNIIRWPLNFKNSAVQCF